MDLRPLTLNDKKVFDAFLKKSLRVLAAYSFENTYIWKPLFDLSWAEARGTFCLFFKNRAGCFMNLPPIGGEDPEVVRLCFDEMERVNRNKDISRIENIEEQDLAFFKREGFRSYEKGCEYLVETKAVAALSGPRFKAQRNLRNVFVKNNQAIFRDYEERDRGEVLRLLEDWSAQRGQKNSDPVYRAMLQDSAQALCILLEERPGIGGAAKVVECAGKIRAFTSGFEVNPDLFCINFEIADLAVKGLAQFVFSEFAKTLSRYREINIMDDSGIENIRRTKLSYRPTRLIPSYTVLLKD